MIEKSIVYIGSNNGNSLSRFEAFEEVFSKSTHIDYNYLFKRMPKLLTSIERRLKFGVTIMLHNIYLYRKLRDITFDILWIEMGREIHPLLLKVIKKNKKVILVNTYSDDFLDKTTNKYSRLYNKSIKYYDYIFTPREVNFDEYFKRGATNVYKFWKGFNEKVIKKQKITAKDSVKYGSDVVFVGHCEPDRVKYITALVEQNIDIKVWGSGWDKYLESPLSKAIYKGKADYYKEYPKILLSSKIVIGFTSDWARDTQNSRMFEVPGIGAFYLAKYTKDLEFCFDLGEEVVSFNNKSEFIEKVKYYLINNNERILISQRGYERSITSNYSNKGRVNQMLNQILKLQN